MHPQQDLSPAEVLGDLMDAIEAKENECLKRIYTRFCFLKGLAIDFSKVTPAGSTTRLNYTEYYYMLGTPQQAFLMSAELVTVNDVPRLNIEFNPSLLDETKETV